MTVLDTSSVRTNWSSVVRQAEQGEDIIITRSGEPSVVLISYEDYESILEQLEDARSARQAEAMIQAIEAGKVKTVPFEDTLRRLAEADNCIP